MRLERRTSKDSSARRIMRLVPVFILETHNQTNYKCWPKFVQTDNASSVWKRPLICSFFCRLVSFVFHQLCLVRAKYLRNASYFQLTSQCFEVWSKTIFRVWYISYIISNNCQDLQTNSKKYSTHWHQAIVLTGNILFCLISLWQCTLPVLICAWQWRSV